jgi:hypothetical protein
MKKSVVSRLVLFLILCFALLLSPIHSKGATFTVTNTADGPNPGIAGSLRLAINQANANGIPDIINFNIPGAGVQTIYPQSQLPQLTDPAGVLIDGLTQPGASAGANPPSTAILLIEINGSQAGASHGLWITSPNNTIQGLVIDSFEQDGIRIEDTPPPPGTVNNVIYCNFTGTDPSGTQDWGNGTNQLSPWAGIDIVVPPGHTGLVANNLVLNNLSSGNYGEGVGISNCPPGDNYGNIVQFNYLGTDITGMNDLGNDHTGVCISEGAHDNKIDGNLISGNGTEGICIIGWPEEEEHNSRNNIILNNTIGLNVNHSSPLKNDREGISIGHYYGDGPAGGDDWWLGWAHRNVIGPNNTIASNGRSGVMIWENPINSTNADWNIITQNSIYDNGPGAPGYLGIDLDDDMVTPNDLLDPDTGPNEELNFPVIGSAVYAAGNTTVSGSIDIDTGPAQATIEIFKADPDPTGYGEGKTYLGAATPDGLGNWSTVVSGLSPGDYVTATTTDLNQNTSEFSSNYILPYIIVTSPNGGENWQVGSNHNITWTSNGTSGNVHIEYSTNNGSSWSDVIASTTDNGSYSWTIPDTPSDSCLVRVSDTDGNPSDVSDALFTISRPSIAVTSPNGGENWQVGSNHNVTWTSNGTSGNVHIEYSTNNGSNWSDVIASTTDDGSYSWTIPNTPSDSCLVRVSDTDGYPSDISDALFTISLIPPMTVTYPNGGEELYVDSVYNITWTSAGTSGTVKIEYSINSGSTWSDVIASTTDDGSYSWTIPNTPSDSCLVRVSDTDGSPSDESDAVFKISPSSAVPFDKLPEVYSMSVRKIAVSNKLEVIYATPKRASVKLGIYDIKGAKIKEFSEEKPAGFYSREIDMTGKPVGVYFIRIEANGGEFTKTGKFVLM